MPLSDTLSIADALKELQKVAPEAPFLALGQTVFWDEPMKAGILHKSLELGYSRKLVAGVHDTDYFAKHAGKGDDHKFRALPHNDTTTRNLWSAVGEFSALFGSETVIAREALSAAGARLRRIARERPTVLDKVTEAWGWRGIVATSDEHSVSAEVPLRELFPVLRETFAWALESSLASVHLEDQERAQARADRFMTLVCEAADGGADLTVSDYYKRLLPEFYRLCSDCAVDVEVSATTQLLQFNPDTCALPRFDIVRCFVEADTRDEARRAYNDAVAGSEIYDLSRFGTGAIPFDLFIPGHGRGTIRLGNRGAVVTTPQPQFLSFKKPVRTLEEFAAAVAAKFGPDCVLVGKAVTLIGMLAREFVFVFHEGASRYVTRSRKLFALLAEGGCRLKLNPILRVRYHAWDALASCCSWLKLPDPFQRPFGVEELCSPSFAGRWREVGAQQEAKLAELGQLRRSIDLIRYLDRTLGGSWSSLAAEYEALHGKLEGLKHEVETIRQDRHAALTLLRQQKQDRVAAETAKGVHFRAKVFEKESSAATEAARAKLTARVEEAIARIQSTSGIVRALLQQQTDVVRDKDVLAIHERRRSIELEAELRRLSLAREAVISSKGLELANRRPSAWWFPIVCPGGKWFETTVEQARCYLETLNP